MPARLAAYALLVGAANLTLAALTVVLIRHCVVPAWLAYLVPLSLVAGIGGWANLGVLWFRDRGDERAARTPRTALALPHAPHSLQALARGPIHRSDTLPARDDL